jgi:signal peptidase I
MIKYLIIFLIGFLTCALGVVYTFSYSGLEVPIGTGLVALEAVSPSDWVDEKDILIFEDKIVINIRNATLANYADTGSMRPLLDANSNGIRIKPKNPDQIKVGDIISFSSGRDVIVHRVIEKGVDEKGIYFITKGDNNYIDDGKIRFDDIVYITIGIIW